MIRHRSASTSFLQKTFRDTGCLIALIAATCRGHAKMSTFAVSGTGERCYIKGLRPVFLRRKVASHPLTVERQAMLEAENVPATGPTLLDDAEWQDLKRICD